jgi:hypothetical protein
VALRQVFSEYFGFACQFSFHRLLHIHLVSFGAGTIGQIVTDVPNTFSLAPLQETEKNYTGFSCNFHTFFRNLSAIEHHCILFTRRKRFLEFACAYSRNFWLLSYLYYYATGIATDAPTTATAVTTTTVTHNRIPSQNRRLLFHPLFFCY